jgi:putative ABC transport system substrate-binding protein
VPSEKKVNNNPILRKEKTRQFYVIILLGVIITGTLVAFLLNNQAKVVTIGIAVWGDDDGYYRNVDSFKAGLETFGFIEDRNIKFFIKNAHADNKVQRTIIQDFINNKVDLIYTITTPATLIAKEMTSEIPIVFSIVTFPVQTGIIERIDNSGNNLVGTSNYVPISNQLDSVSNIVSFTKIGFVHRDGEPNSEIQFMEIKDYAVERGIEIIEIAPRNMDEVEGAVLHVIDDVDIFYNACDTLIQTGANMIVIRIASENKKPVVACNEDDIIAGGLFGSVANFKELGMQSGQQAALILQGIKPSSLVTEFQKNEYILINLKTAKLLEIEIPEEILVIADEVIQ